MANLRSEYRKRVETIREWCDGIALGSRTAGSGLTERVPKGDLVRSGSPLVHARRRE